MCLTLWNQLSVGTDQHLVTSVLCSVGVDADPASQDFPLRYSVVQSVVIVVEVGLKGNAAEKTIAGVIGLTIKKSGCGASDRSSEGEGSMCIKQKKERR